MDVKEWANDAYELAKNNVYPDVTAGKALPASYIEKNQQALMRNIVLGGLRLSFVIQNIFGSSSYFVPENASFLN